MFKRDNNSCKNIFSLALAGTDKSVGASSRRKRGCGFHSQSVCVQEQNDISLTSVFLSPFPSLSMSPGKDWKKCFQFKANKNH